MAHFIGAPKVVQWELGDYACRNSTCRMEPPIVTSGHKYGRGNLFFSITVVVSVYYVHVKYWYCPHVIGMFNVNFTKINHL